MREEAFENETQPVEEVPPVEATPSATPIEAETTAPSTEEDAYYYALGLVVQEYSGQPSYARYVRPKPACDSAATPAKDAHTRSRAGRVPPQAITHGGYRTKRGSDHRVNIQ